MTIPNHFSSPLLSNFQSAVAKIVTSPVGRDIGAALKRLPLKFEDTFVAASAYACHAFEKGQQGLPPDRPPNEAEKVAKALLNIAVCKMQGDFEAVQAAEEEFKKFGEFDVGWSECLIEFISHYTVTDHGDVPYKRWSALGDFVINIPDTCRIGVVGDWGTNDVRAQFLLEKLVDKDVDVLIHLGDIYYSCTSAEAESFHENMMSALAGRKPAQVYTLCGNHDMYSGGAPYYALVNRLKQPASFFCLRNAGWQILAADTGYNDFDPTSFGGLASWIQDDDDPNSPYSELEWHEDKLQNSLGRRTIFMTHHQPFSRNSGWSGTSINNRLLGQLKPHLAGIDLWMWGHEHNQVIYEPFAGVQRGRCVGASAIPTPSKPDMYMPDPSIIDAVPALINDSSKLGIDMPQSLYNLGYAVIELNNEACTERYYEVDCTSKQERVLFEASF